MNYYRLDREILHYNIQYKGDAPVRVGKRRLGNYMYS